MLSKAVPSAYADRRLATDLTRSAPEILGGFLKRGDDLLIVFVNAKRRRCTNHFSPIEAKRFHQIEAWEGRVVSWSSISGEGLLVATLGSGDGSRDASVGRDCSSEPADWKIGLESQAVHMRLSYGTIQHDSGDN